MTELIAALDVPDYNECSRYLDQISGEVTWVKLGLELFTKQAS